MSNWRLEGSVGWIIRGKEKESRRNKEGKGTQVWLLAGCNEGGWKERRSSEGGIMKGKNDGCVKVSHGGYRTSLRITSKLLLQSHDLTDRMPRGLLGKRNILLRIAWCPFLMTARIVDVFFPFLQKLLLLYHTKQSDTDGFILLYNKVFFCPNLVKNRPFLPVFQMFSQSEMNMSAFTYRWNSTTT